MEKVPVTLSPLIRQVAWNDHAAAGLSRALEPDIRDIVAAQVKSGRAQLWECSAPGHAAWVVTRVDAPPVEWVIVAFEGTGLHTFAPHFVTAAKARGVPFRVHTMSPVIARMIRRYGFDDRNLEYIVRSVA